MIKLVPLTNILYKAWLRARLERCTRDLDIIAAQRANDFQAERLLHREVIVVRAKLHAL
jgi:hypothetical protein